MEFTGTVSWARLPAEIRLMILNQLVHAAEQDGSSLASYAAVCSEWQDAIEPVTFWSLNFTAALLDAPGFSEMATRAWRLGLVRRVCVFISLPEYGCPECERPPRLRNMGRRSGTMTTARHVLNKSFCILNGWDRQGDLSLDITIQSASDADHYFKDMDIGPPRRTTTTPLSVTQDPRHGWVAGRRVSLPPEGAILRLFEPIEVVDTALLPQVTAVTRLVLRRQTTRRWDLIDLDGILRRCVKLKEFHFEPWRGWTSFEAELEDDGTQYAIGHPCLDSPHVLAAPLTIPSTLRYPILSQAAAPRRKKSHQTRPLRRLLRRLRHRQRACPSRHFRRAARDRRRAPRQPPREQSPRAG